MKKQRGQIMVEFIFAVTLLFSLGLASMDLGLLFIQQSALEGLARKAVRQVSLSGLTEEVQLQEAARWWVNQRVASPIAVEVKRRTLGTVGKTPYSSAKRVEVIHLALVKTTKHLILIPPWGTGVRLTVQAREARVIPDHRNE